MRNIKSILLFSFGFVVIYNLFFFKVSLGLGFGVIVLLLNAYFFLTSHSESTNNTQAIITSSLSVIFGFLYGYRANEIIRILDFLLSIFFLLTTLYLYKLDKPFNSKLPDYLFIPIQTVISSIGSFFSLFNKSTSTSETKSPNLKFSLLRGILITIPIFLILLFFLVQADPIFGKFASNFFSSIGKRSLTSIIIFIILVALGVTKLKEKLEEEKTELEIDHGKSHELSIILGSITLLFTSFIVVQFKYLFSKVSERELAQLGMKSLTFSEYINKGFFELLVVTSIVSLVIIYVLRYIHKLKSTNRLVVQGLSALVIFETGLILLSDIQRVFLYAEAHGLTRARVFGFIFLVWLSLFLIILIYKTFVNVKEKWFLNSFLGISIAMLLITNLINIDGIIAGKYKPTVNREIDYYYLTSLSTDASKSWNEALVEMETQIQVLEQDSDLSPDDSRKIYWAKNTLINLERKIAYLKNRYSGDFKWQEFNLSEYSAFHMISREAVFWNLENLINRVNALDTKINEAVRQDTQLDRSTNPPLSH